MDASKELGGEDEERGQERKQEELQRVRLVMGSAYGARSPVAFTPRRRR